MDPFGRGRINLGEPLECPSIPTFFNLLGKPESHTLITGRCFSQTKIKMLEIERSAPAEDWDFPLCMDLTAGLVGIRNKIPYTELLPGVENVDKIVGNGLEGYRVGLGRPYIQVSVHLDGVGIDH